MNDNNVRSRSTAKDRETRSSTHLEMHVSAREITFPSYLQNPPVLYFDKDRTRGEDGR